MKKFIFKNFQLGMVVHACGTASSTPGADAEGSGVQG
jgi:hypothetical protein